jgi:periplasmic copper chaperone A
MEVPGTTVVTLVPDGPHVVLSGLTRPLVPGESIIVTLVFEKSGGIGVITVVE